jgi:hypothetical protein
MNTPGLFPIVGDRGDSLKRRLQHVLAGARIAPRVGRRWILGACVVTLAAVAGIGFAQQGATPPAPVSKTDGGKSAPAEVSPVVAGNQATRSASTQVARPETAPKPASAAKQVPAASDRTPPSAAKNENGPRLIRGTVSLPDGRPAAGAEILALRRYWSNRVSSFCCAGSGRTGEGGRHGSGQRGSLRFASHGRRTTVSAMDPCGLPRGPTDLAWCGFAGAPFSRHWRRTRSCSGSFRNRPSMVAWSTWKGGR